MNTLDKDAVADIRSKVNDALSGIQIPHPQQQKLDKVWSDLERNDQAEKSAKSAPAGKKVA